MTQTELTLGQRLRLLLQHLGVPRAHFATRTVNNLGDLPATNPEVIASLTLVCPSAFDPASLAGLQSEVLLVRGDQGRIPGAGLPVPVVTTQVLKDYHNALWADTAADRPGELSAWMLHLLGRASLPAVPPHQAAGEVAGITYRTTGTGPPLLLLPLGLSASQWEPVLPQLNAGHCVITLGGPYLDPVSNLEDRAGSDYSRMVFDLLDDAGLAPGLSVLEAGCGCGALVRRLAARTHGANSITGLDINRYLLGEALALARREGLEGAIDFREGSVEAIPFPDDSFDFTFSSTVMEEVDADRMMAELVRVTKPRGRVAVIVRSVDRPQWVNLPLSPALKAKVETASGRMSPKGCADASLYRRFAQAGLTQVRGYPRLVAAPLDHPWGRRNAASTQADLTPTEAQEWQAALAQAQQAAMLPWIARPFHCAVGTKPVR